MIKLERPLIDDEELLEKIINNKNLIARNILNCIKNKVKERYNFYLESSLELENITPIREWDNCKVELNSCYGINTELNKVKKKIIEFHEKTLYSKCPFCLINRHNTFDHFFDKSQFPEFSVFTPNLIPCCSECNTLKGTKLFVNDERLFINFYFDEIPKEQFLFFRFYYNVTNIPEINIFLNFNEECSFEVIIRSHFEKLKLIDKYKIIINEKFSTIINEIKLMNYENIEMNYIKQNLDIRYKSLIEIYGKNYWETCIYDGVINSENFIEETINYFGLQ